MNNSYISHKPEDTIKFAKQIAKQLKGGELIGLNGDLGSGKTVFTQGLAKALGVKGKVNSPTFVLMKIYGANKGNIKNLIHVDAYRLGNDSNLANIGIDEYLDSEDCVVVVEWYDYIKTAIRSKAVTISFKYIDKDTREIGLS